MVTFLSTPILLIAAIVALAAVYVLLPVGLATYRRVRGPRAVTCPETGKPEVIEVDAAEATLASLFGHDERRVVFCSRWPENSDCERGCTKQLS